MKCVHCDKEAEYIYLGRSLCKEHYKKERENVKNRMNKDSKEIRDSSGVKINKNKDFECPLCEYEGPTSIRNAYKNQGKNIIGFAAEEYCPGCKTALHRIPMVLEARKRIREFMKGKE